jgi:hypothetical protein
MRTLVLLGFIVGGLVVAGAIHISKTGDNVEISVDTRKVEAITGAVVREGETIVRNARTAAPPTQSR